MNEPLYINLTMTRWGDEPKIRLATNGRHLGTIEFVDRQAADFFNAFIAQLGRVAGE